MVKRKNQDQKNNAGGSRGKAQANHDTLATEILGNDAVADAQVIMDSAYPSRLLNDHGNKALARKLTVMRGYYDSYISSYVNLGILFQIEQDKYLVTEVAMLQFYLDECHVDLLLNGQTSIETNGNGFEQKKTNPSATLMWKHQARIEAILAKLGGTPGDRAIMMEKAAAVRSMDAYSNDTINNANGGNSISDFKGAEKHRRNNQIGGK